MERYVTETPENNPPSSHIILAVGHWNHTREIYTQSILHSFLDQNHIVFIWWGTRSAKLARELAATLWFQSYSQWHFAVLWLPAGLAVCGAQPPRWGPHGNARSPWQCVPAPAWRAVSTWHQNTPAQAGGTGPTETTPCKVWIVSVLRLKDIFYTKRPQKPNLMIWVYPKFFHNINRA